MKNSTKSSKGMGKIMLLFLILLTFLFPNCSKVIDESTNQKQPEYQFGLIATPTAIYSAIPNAPAPPPAGNLPSSFFLPIPAVAFNQGQQGSCVSCASSMTKSIMDYLKFNTPFPNNGITYSPSYLFNQCHADPNNCLVGSYINTNLNVLKNQGICRLSEMAYDPLNCTTQPTNTQKTLAAHNKIDNYYKIDPISISMIKEIINSGLPVIVAFQVDDFFMSATSNSIWKQFNSPSRGNHCTLLYGWDDSKTAFKMLNSWGSQWGNNGTIWLDYNFLQNGLTTSNTHVFYEAYLMLNPAVTPSSPIADFDLNGANTTITQGQQVTFRDRSQNDPISWTWTFPGGNPSSSTSRNPTVTYSNSGVFNVTLTATNQAGSNSLTKLSYINVTQATNVPVADFDVNGATTTLNAGQQISFRDKSVNNPTSWSWSFPGGNPSSSNLQNPVVTYNNSGSFNVTLISANQAGSNSITKSSYINVSSNPSWTCGQPFIDTRDGKSYTTINIGGQCWMSQNFDYNTNGSMCYSNNCSLGRLYDFNTALNTAPPGWHLPTDVEWQQLELYLGMNPNVVNNFGCRGDNQGNQVILGGSSGLNLTKGGNASQGANSIQFYDYGNSGHYWTSSNDPSNNPGVSKIARAITILNPPAICKVNGNTTGVYYSVRYIRN